MEIQLVRTRTVVLPLEKEGPPFFFPKGRKGQGFAGHPLEGLALRKGWWPSNPLCIHIPTRGKSKERPETIRFSVRKLDTHSV